MNDLQVVHVTAPLQKQCDLTVYLVGRRRAEAGPGLVRDSCAQEIHLLRWWGVHSSELCYSNGFSEPQDGHCLRVCRDAEYQAPLQTFRIRTYRGVVSTLKVSEALL